MSNWAVYALERQCKTGTSMLSKASDELGRLCPGGPDWAVFALERQCKTGTSMLWKASDELGRLAGNTVLTHHCLHVDKERRTPITQATPEVAFLPLYIQQALHNMCSRLCANLLCHK